MRTAIQRLLAGEAGAPELDAFLDRHQFPLQEGTTTTFVYRGDADSVRLRHFVYGLPSSQPFERLPDTDFWYLVFELPGRARIEYKFEVRSNGRTEWLLDPLNPLQARDPFGANSVCQTMGYEAPLWAEPDEHARPGEIVPHDVDSAVFGEPRAWEVYLPPQLRSDRSYPLLLVHDGADFVRYSSLKSVLDNLIYRLEIPPLVVALHRPSNRLVEYAGDADHARHLQLEVVPGLRERFPIDPSATATGLLGASFGAVAALASAWHAPGLFGRLLLLSGSFAFTDVGEEHARGPTFDPVVRFMNAFREAPGHPADRIFVACGIYESLIYENRSLVPLLQASGMDVRYVEARDGHNWENWRDRLREGLSWLFPGPLWMVYE